MSEYTVTARRWEGGWELHIDGVGVTQCRTLDQADQEVRDYIETLTDKDASAATVTIIPELGGLEREVSSARDQARAAAEAQVAAAERSRKVVRKLQDAGLSVSDMAAVLGVSRGRISQLTSASEGRKTRTVKKTAAQTRITTVTETTKRTGGSAKKAAARSGRYKVAAKTAAAKAGRAAAKPTSTKRNTRSQ